MRFVPLNERHVPEAVALSQEAYTRELEHVPALAADDVSGLLLPAITELAQNGHGIAAFDDRLMGYMSFFGPIPHFFGSGTGCFSPLHGHAAAGSNRNRLYSLLFQHASELMTAQGVDTFAITTYRHDHEIATALSLNGFGIRNADAIREIGPPLDVVPTPGITYEEMHWSDAAGRLLPLKNGLVRHLRQSPTYVAADEFSPAAFATLCEVRRSRFFVARDAAEPFGYMEITSDGENILTTAPDMRNICGAFLLEEHRGRGIYQNLLQLVLTTLREEGVERIGVDFETMNPTALGFWTKYFDCYTHSFARRIDDLG